MGRRRLAAGHVPKQVPNLMRKKKCEPFLQKLPLFTGHIRIWFAFLECSHFMLIFANMAIRMPQDEYDDFKYYWHEEHKTKTRTTACQ